MKLSVMIPTYRRATDLERCLEGLHGQLRPADQIIVVVRTTDEPTMEVVTAWQDRLPIEAVRIEIPGVVQAMNRGREIASGDILTVTDDDTSALPDWLQRIERHFEQDPKVGGVGGRDLIHEDGGILPERDVEVGVIKFYGRIFGNHHQGRGPSREVDHLKGVNMSWRAEAIRDLPFPTDLRGAGAQVFFELAFSLAVQGRDWRLVYDPAIQVNHFVAQRHDNDKRVFRDPEVLYNSAFNLYVSLRYYMKPGLKRTMALAWVHYLGAFGHPGVLRGLVARVRGDRAAIEVRAAVARAWDDAQAIPRALSGILNP